jgi:hypothetical protein
LDEKKEIQNSVQTVERKIGALDSQWRTRTDIQIADKAMKSIRLLLK